MRHVCRGRRRLPCPAICDILVTFLPPPCPKDPKIGATSILIHLAGGVALLLWGLRMVRTGVMRAFDGDLRAAIGSALGNRFLAFGCGLGVTALLQS